MSIKGGSCSSYYSNVKVNLSAQIPVMTKQVNIKVVLLFLVSHLLLVSPFDYSVSFLFIFPYLHLQF